MSNVHVKYSGVVYFDYMAVSPETITFSELQAVFEGGGILEQLLKDAQWAAETRRKEAFAAIANASEDHTIEGLRALINEARRAEIAHMMLCALRYSTTYTLHNGE